MRAKLRTWMKSWQVWVIVACLAYIWGILWWGPAIVAVWPRGRQVALGFLMVALLVLSCFPLKYIVVPALMFLQGVKKGGRTAKAKEKLADSLMSFSTAVSSAVAIGALVFPFTVFIQTMAKGIDPLAVVVSWWPPQWLSWSHTAVFLSLFWAPVITSLLFRRQALDLYDEIASSTSVVAPIPQGTHERPRSLDPGPPVYVKANEGSRRQRRHRTK